MSVYKGSISTLKASGQRSEYVGVYISNVEGSLVYNAQLQIGNRKWSQRFDNEREAAIAVDKWRISSGKEPINILKRK